MNSEITTKDHRNIEVDKLAIYGPDTDGLNYVVVVKEIRNRNFTGVVIATNYNDDDGMKVGHEGSSFVTSLFKYFQGKITIEQE